MIASFYHNTGVVKYMKRNKKFFSPETLRNIIIAGLICVVSLAVLYKLTEWSRGIDIITYSDFLDKVESGQVKKVIVSGQEVSGLLENGLKIQTVLAETDSNWNLFRKNAVDVTVEPAGGEFPYWMIFPFVLLIAILAAAWFFFKQKGGFGGGGGGPGNIFGMGKSRAKMFLPSQIKERFTSFAGAAEAKEEVADVVDFLKNPKKYKKLGAKIPKGLLLIGEPGNGKTLLARAVAGEANCPFFAISGSDFIEVFVGVGAARVRDLFAQARKHAPCIVFIDEIDAVGRQRGSGLGGGNDEREQTLNQLLSEMDGFETEKNPIIVLAATNRHDVLDKALLRPGRFDRQVMVPYPDLQSREQILDVHAKKVKVSSEVDLKKIARGTPGFSGADLQNLINEAAIIASKKNLKEVTVEEFEQARDKLMLGKEIKSIRLTEEDKKLIAYHEAGHALVRLLLPKYSDPLHKVTIIPRGRTLGVTHSMPEREKYISTKEEMEASILSALGGRAAEDIQFNQLTTGAASDFYASTDIVRSMICDYGMNEKLGQVIYKQRGEYIYSEETGKVIDEEVKRMVEMYYQKAKDLLQKNKDKLDTLSVALLEKETLYAAEIYELLGIESREGHLLH